MNEGGGGERDRRAPRCLAGAAVARAWVQPGDWRCTPLLPQVARAHGVPTPGLLSPTLPCSHPGRERLPDPQERGGVAPPAPQVTQVTQSYAFYYPGPRARGPGGAELSGASPALGTQFPLWRFPRRGASELAWVRRRSGPGREPRRPSKWLLCAPPSAQVPQCPGWRSSGRASPATLAFEDPRRPWARAAT